MVLKNCVICGETFGVKSTAITCSPECSRKKSNERQRKRQRKQMQNPEYQKQKNKRERERYANNPEMRERKIKQRRERMKDPKHREHENKYQREYQRELYANDPEYRERKRRGDHSRRAAKVGLAYPVTPKQWDYALSYFHGCCAVCQHQLDGMFGDTKTHQDHWIPHNVGGDYIATNIVPLCRTCNLLKGATAPSVWLKRKYSKRKSAQIIERIETYFEDVKEQS